MAEIQLTRQNYDQLVLHADRPVLIDFGATWCWPCRIFTRVVDEICQSHPEIHVAKVDIDEESELAAFLQVCNVPTLVLVKNGKIVQFTSGCRTKEEIEEML